MKKKGFTLAELLITMGIIGIVAAILAPSLGNLKPDSDKAKVLKVYNTLLKVNQEMIEDPGLYTGEDGFKDTSAPNNPDYSSCTSGTKYACILVKKLEAQDINISGTKYTFKTDDGIKWEISSPQVLIITEDDGKTPCTYSSTCKKPKAFSFIVILHTGDVIGQDPLTQAYILNPYKMSDKKKDYDKAATLKAVSTNQE